MRVLFLRPSQEGFFHTVERNFPIGMLYIAQQCIVNGHEIKVFDSLVEGAQPYEIPVEQLSELQKARIRQHPIFSSMLHYGATDERILAEIGAFNPQVIAISIMFSSFYDTAYRIAKLIKKHNPNIIIVTGGAHVSMQYQHVLDNYSVDFVLLGEGEVTLPQLMDAISANENPRNIPGVGFRTFQNANAKTYFGEDIYINSCKEYISELDKYVPAVDKIDCTKYNGAATIITSRGCPYNCSFCAVKHTMGKEYRVRSVGSVLAELDRYQTRYGISKLFIEDDNFTFDTERTKSLLKRIVDRQLKVNLFLLNGVSAIGFDDELVELFSKSGVKKLFVGLETTDDDARWQIAKAHISLAAIKSVVRKLETYNICAGVSLIIGLPHQWLANVVDDIVCLLKMDIPILAINPLYPLPGTEIYNECINLGLLKKNLDFTFLGGDNFVISPNDISGKDLYYIWIFVRAIAHWGIKGRDLYQDRKIANIKNKFERSCELNKIEILEGKIQLTYTRERFEQVYHIISPNHQLERDMLSAIMYIFTRDYYVFCVESDSEQICFKGVTSTEIAPPSWALILNDF